MPGRCTACHGAIVQGRCGSCGKESLYLLLLDRISNVAKAANSYFDSRVLLGISQDLGTRAQLSGALQSLVEHGYVERCFDYRSCYLLTRSGYALQKERKEMDSVPDTDDAKVSVAPVEGTVSCPKCGRHGYSLERSRGRHGANRCHWRDCGHEEWITEDHVPRMWTEVELRTLMHEEALKVSASSENGQPVLGGGEISSTWSPPGSIMPKRFSE